MNEKYQLYLTQQGLKSLKLIATVEPENYKNLYHYLLTDLRYYPWQGRLLLNRDTRESETAQLNQQLAERFKNIEIRDVCYSHWLIIYLNHQSKLYLLDFISLKNTYVEATPIWCEE